MTVTIELVAGLMTFKSNQKTGNESYKSVVVKCEFTSHGIKTGCGLGFRLRVNLLLCCRVCRNAPTHPAISATNLQSPRRYDTPMILPQFSRRSFSHSSRTLVKP